MDTQIPIVIGFSGHRDIRSQDIFQIKAKLRDIFNDIKKLCSENTPMVLLNSLAEGADQICCEVAVEQNIDIVAVLPREKDSYEKDFEGEVKDNFNKYLSLSKEVIVTNNIEGKNDSSYEYGYRQAGIYVASHAHIMIVMWNGQLPKPQGCGTAEVVDFALKHSYTNPNGTQFNAPNDAVVAWITTPRVSNPNNIEKIEVKYLTSSNTYDTIPLQLKEICDYTNEFNDEEVTYEHEDWYYLLSKETLQECSPMQKRIHDIYIKANIASTKYRDKFKKCLKWLAILGVLVVLFFMAYDEAESNLFMPLCFVAIVLSLLIYYFANPARGDYHRKFIEYRALAETLRTQFYVSCWGLDDCVCDYYTWSQKNEIVWIKELICAIMITKNYQCTNHLNEIKENWIGNKTSEGYDKCGQLGYHKNKVRKENKRLEKSEKISKIILISTIVFYTIILILELFFPSVMGLEVSLNNEVIRSIFIIHEGQSILIRGIFKIILSSMAAISLFLANYYGKMSISRVCQDSSKMAKLYEIALDIWDDERIKKEDIIRELAREEVTENGIWLSYYRDNSLDINT